MQVKVTALCEILQGPTEVVNVFASADVVRYSVDKQIIDFGQQVNHFSVLITAYISVKRGQNLYFIFIIIILILFRNYQFIGI